MSTALERLAGRIRDELAQIERVLERVATGWEQARRSHDDLYLDSVALNLHGFYNGLERLFEVIATVVDGQRPTGERWHQELLEQMATELPGVRPAVISQNTYTQLDEYRSFRHIVRNVYTFHFDPDRMANLVSAAPAVFSQVEAEMRAFADFLEARA